jgi:hypothetical protein
MEGSAAYGITTLVAGVQYDTKNKILTIFRPSPVSAAPCVRVRLSSPGARPKTPPPPFYPGAPTAAALPENPSGQKRLHALFTMNTRSLLSITPPDSGAGLQQYIAVSVTTSDTGPFGPLCLKLCPEIPSGRRTEPQPLGGPVCQRRVSQRIDQPTEAIRVEQTGDSRFRLSKRSYMNLPSGLWLVSNVYAQSGEPVFVGRVATPAGRAAQWLRLTRTGADQRMCRVFCSEMAFRDWEAEMRKFFRAPERCSADLSTARTAERTVNAGPILPHRRTISVA